MAETISLAGWSINRRFRREEDPLTLLEYPGVVKEEFGISAVELNSPFFLSTDDTYLKDLVEAGKRAGVVFTGMALDGTGDPSSLDETARQESVNSILPWFQVSKKLGLPLFRVNTGGHGNETEPRAVEQCIKSFRELVKQAEATGVKIVIENHWGISVNPHNTVQIIKEVGSEMLGTLPDFGNFPDAENPRGIEGVQDAIGDMEPNEIRYWGVELMAPYALAVHAKMYTFDAAGEDPRVDVERLVRIMKDAGYSGYWGIEFEGPGDDHEGVLKSKALLEKYINA